MGSRFADRPCFALTTPLRTDPGAGSGSNSTFAETVASLLVKFPGAFDPGVENGFYNIDNVTPVDAVNVNVVIILMVGLGFVLALLNRSFRAAFGEKASGQALLEQSGKALPLTHGVDGLEQQQQQQQQKQHVGRAVVRPALTAAELLVLQAQSEPSRRALVVLSPGEERVEVTYGDLGTRVASMARQFVHLGVKPGDRVILKIHRGLHQLVSVYACMTCGAVFVPVDPDVPESWLQFVLADGEAVLLVEEARRSVAPTTTEADITCVEAPADGSPLRKVGGGAEVEESSAPLPKVGGDDHVVIFYTSGSTGKPKGVLHTHAQLQNAAFGIAEDANVEKGSIVLLRSPAVWSTYEWEAFPALMVGATLIVAEPQGHKDPMYLVKVLSEEAVNMMAITPKSLDLVLDVAEQSRYTLRHLKDVASTGEQLPTSLANRFVKLLPQARLHNGYNPTESAACTWYRVPATGLDLQLYPTNVPAGIPQPGVSVYIMAADKPSELLQLGEGEEGEILLGGLLSEGYWRRPELTADKFVQSKLFGRLYHTGDKGKWVDGQLLTLGRIDRQVKIRGVRVEPEEVEAVLSGRWSELRAARREEHKEGALSGAGVACVASLGDSPQLVAFVAPVASQQELATLEAHVRAELPAYYTPSRFHALERLPALPNGKVDLKTLQQQATELSAQVELFEDSLGRTKSMLQDTLREQEVIWFCNSTWLSGIMVSHWYTCSAYPKAVGIPFVKVVFSYCMNLPLNTPGWVELVLRSLSGYHCVMGMTFVAAYNDSSPPVLGDKQPAKNAPRMRLGQTDLLLLWAYLAIGFWAIAWNRYHQAPLHDRVFGAAHVAHRWWAWSILMARLCIRACQKLETAGSVTIPPLFQALVPLLIVVALPMESTDVCGASPRLPLWFRWVVGTLGGVQNAGPAFCSLTPGGPVLEMIPYILAFHYLRPLVRSARAVVRARFDGPLFAILAFGLYMLGTTAMGYWRFGNQFDPERGLEDPQTWKFVPLDWAFNLCMAGLLVLVASWIPFSAKRTGQAALGIYVFHLNFPVDTMLAKLNELSLTGVPLLLACVMPVYLWMLLIGPMAHFVIMLPVKILRHLAPKAVL
ncbi:unnamed protein product [Polarella glacialis]|uniref:AMP-dependent synthetase/ligase domain-containing protein n=1 Tax=Polarella glacialis TaxID=89957 RepID=A0A813FLK9_POLGL|nr:unnamed protein product [Polarella glacialis]|mmetsp:Transcript_41968/g.75938  ORF Transcript_41968/g.75938 Transcript_41968/m.75938 type:complete len:1097 (-) Transcript_41968:113-3403(-)